MESLIISLVNNEYVSTFENRYRREFGVLLFRNAVDAQYWPLSVYRAIQTKSSLNHPAHDLITRSNETPQHNGPTKSTRPDLLYTLSAHDDIENTRTKCHFLISF